MSDLSIQTLTELLADPNIYENQVQPLLFNIKDKNDPKIFKIFRQTIMGILSEKKFPPLTKLTSLRLLKDSFVQGNANFIQSMETSLIQSVYKIAIYRHDFKADPENKKQNRGDKYFIEVEGKIKDNKMIRYGNMFVNFAAEIVVCFSKLYPKNIEGRPSIFQKTITKYSNLKAPVPPQKFFMVQDQKKFKHNLKQWVKNMQKQVNQKQNNNKHDNKQQKQNNKQQQKQSNKKQAQIRTKTYQNNRIPKQEMKQNNRIPKQQIKQNNSEQLAPIKEQLINKQVKQTDKNIDNKQIQNNSKIKQQIDKQVLENKGTNKIKQQSQIIVQKQPNLIKLQTNDLNSTKIQKNKQQINSENLHKQQNTHKQQNIIKRTHPIQTNKATKIIKIGQKHEKQAQNIEVNIYQPITHPKTKQQNNCEQKQQKQIQHKQQSQFISTSLQNRIRKQYEGQIQILQKRIKNLTQINNQYLTIIMKQQQNSQNVLNSHTQKQSQTIYEQKVPIKEKQQTVPIKEKQKLKNMKIQKPSFKTQAQSFLPKNKIESGFSKTVSQYLSKTNMEYFSQKSTVKQNNQQMVFPQLFQYFSPLKFGQNDRFRQCCFLETGDKKQFFSTQELEMHIIKALTDNLVIQIVNKSQQTIRIKIFSENKQIYLLEDQCQLNSFQRIQFHIKAQIYDLNFRYPIFNVSTKTSQQQVVYRIPIPITLLTFTKIKNRNMKLEIPKKNINTRIIHKTVQFCLGQNFRDLKKLMPDLRLVKNNGNICASGNLAYIFMPQINLQIEFQQKNQMCTISIQVQADNTTPNSSFSKVILQILMYLLS